MCVGVRKLRLYIYFELLHTKLVTLGNRIKEYIDTITINSRASILCSKYHIEFWYIHLRTKRNDIPVYSNRSPVYHSSCCGFITPLTTSQFITIFVCTVCRCSNRDFTPIGVTATTATCVISRLFRSATCFNRLF